MITEATFTKQLDDLLESYQILLKICYDALDENTTPAQRATVRNKIEQFVTNSND